jgi:hypothetical protein
MKKKELGSSIARSVGETIPVMGVDVIGQKSKSVPLNLSLCSMLNTVRQKLIELDTAAIEKYNERQKNRRHKLRLDMGPSLYEGDIFNAPIVLLLANPGNGDVGDHEFSRDGWPLAGLHDDAPPGIRDWWRPRLRSLTERFGAHHVSNRIAALQLTPWASDKWDANLRLPSREYILQFACEIAKRDPVFIVMRAKTLWLECSAFNESQKLYTVNSFLSSYLTAGNLSRNSGAWQTIVDALRD